MKEMKVEIPAGCEVEKVETQDDHVVVTLREKERKLPKSWEEFCEMFPIQDGECVINPCSSVTELKPSKDLYYMGQKRGKRHVTARLVLPDKAIAEAVLALCQLIQLRNCYNGDWVPDWKDYRQDKHAIVFCGGKIFSDTVAKDSTTLHFKSADLRDEFLRNFRPLIEKLKPLYGVKEGGEE